MLNNKYFKLIAFLFALAILFIVIRFSGVYTVLTPQNIRDYILGFGILAPAIFILLYFIRTFFLFPASVLSVASGLAFGPFWGTVYTISGATISASTAFILSKLYGRDIMDKICKSCGSAVDGMDKQIGDKGFLLVFFLRIVPIFPYDGINFAAGFSKIKFWPYFFATFIGMIPGSFAYNYLGGSLLNIRDPKILLAIALILISISTPTIYKAVKGIKNNGRDY